MLVRCTACRFTWPYRNKKLHTSSSRPSQLFLPNRHWQQIDLEVIGIVFISASLARPLTFAWSRSDKKPATGPSDASGEGQTLFLCARIFCGCRRRRHVTIAKERRGLGSLQQQKCTLVRPMSWFLVIPPGRSETCTPKHEDERKFHLKQIKKLDMENYKLTKELLSLTH